MAIIKNTLDNALQNYSLGRLTATSVSVYSSNSSFTLPKNTATVSPASIVLDTDIIGYSFPIYTWYYSTSSNLSLWTSLSTGASLNISNSAYLLHLGSNNSFVRYKVVVTQNGWASSESYFDVNYLIQPNELPILSFSKDNLALPTSSTDIVSYTNATIDISVSISGTSLPYAVSGPNTFNVTLGSIVGTAVLSPSTSGNIRVYTLSGMNGTGLTSTAAIPFVVTIRDSRNTVTTISKTVVASKVVSGTAGTNGTNAVSAHLSNDAAVVATDSSGNNGNYTATPTEIYVLEGSSNLTYATSGTTPGTFKIGTPVQSNISVGSITGNGTDKATVSASSSITFDVASIRFPITAYLSNNTVANLSVTQSISRTRSGAAGSSPTAYAVSGSVPVLTKTGTSFSPTTVTFTGYSNTATISSLYSGWFKIFENGSTTASYTSTVAESVIVYTPSGSMTSLVCKMYSSNSFLTELDAEGLSIVSNGTNGTNAVSAHLSNDAAVVATDSSGNNGNYTATPTEIYVLEGSSNLTYATSGTTLGTFKIGTPVQSNISVGSITGNGTDKATVSASSSITFDVASIRFPITAYLSNNTVANLSVTQSISRNKSGAAGSSPTAYAVSGSVPVLTKTGTSFSPTTVTFTGYSNTATISSLYSGWFKIFENGSTTASYTSTIAESAIVYTPSGSMTSLVCKMYSSNSFLTELDAEGLSVVSNGTNGTNAVSVYTATVYYQGGTTPTITSSTGSYNFSTNTLIPPTGNINWLPSQPASSTTPTYSSSFTFTTNTPNITVNASGTWSPIIVEAINGSPGNNGEYRDIVQLYLNASSTPSPPTSIPYTFSTNTLGTQSGGTGGWNLSQPLVPSYTSATYMTSAVATTTAPESPVTLSNFTTPVTIARQGAPGANSTVAGPSGSTAVYAYRVVTGASLPTAPAVPTGAPTGGSAITGGGWYSSPKATLSSSDWQFMASGTLSYLGTYTWTSPAYLATFKVGTLEALSSNLGTITAGTLATTGYISSKGTGTLATSVIKPDGVTASSFTAAGIFNETGATNNIGAIGKSSHATTSIGVYGEANTHANSTGLMGIAYYGVIGRSVTAGGVGIVGQLGAGVAATGVRGDSTSSVSSIGVHANGGAGGTGLYVTGSSKFTGQITSTLAAGTAPFAVTSNTICTNLNVERLGGRVVSDMCYILVGTVGTATASGGGFTLISTGTGTQFRCTGNSVTLEPASDSRLKEDIVDIDKGLDFVNKLRPVSYRLISKPTKYYGFIAQEVGDIIGRVENDCLFSTTPEGMHGTDYVAIIPALVKAVQELTQRVQVLENIIEGK